MIIFIYYLVVKITQNACALPRARHRMMLLLTEITFGEAKLHGIYKRHTRPSAQTRRLIDFQPIDVKQRNELFSFLRILVVLPFSVHR